jgi:hypothetical protein
MSKRLFLLLVVAVTGLSCTRKPEPEAAPIYDRVVKTPGLPPERIVQKTMTVESFISVDFEVPANCLSPRLTGKFKSFRYGNQGNRASDDLARVDLLLLDDQQYNDFTHASGDATTRTVQNAFEQQVDWALPSTFTEARKYHLVFNNSTGKPKSKFVDADFILSFQ